MSKPLVFISWSGSRSHEIAKLLAGWIPEIVHGVRTFVSSSDIDKGDAWTSVINASLADSSFGILVVTPENRNAPWLTFEAGAMAAKWTKPRCCPLLCALVPSDLAMPLAQFNATVASDKADVLKLLSTLSSIVEPGGVESQVLSRRLDRMWEDFSAPLSTILLTPLSPAERGQAAARPDRQLLEEILDTVRQLRAASDADKTSEAVTAAQRKALEVLAERLRTPKASSIFAPQNDEFLRRIEQAMKRAGDELK
ncbi:MAG TPA: TIR domain-containing protein [Phycisphaerales bacterium]|nr:TIR domain-containing protein [Phycisphaerales bacterium]